MKNLSPLIIATLVCTATSFGVIKPASTSTSSSNTALKSHSEISRRNALQGLMVPAIATIATSFAQPAFADVTNKVASQSALRYVKRSMKELEKLEMFAAQNDYSEIKQGIRGPGLSEVRKNMQVLIRGGEDGPEAANLKTAYDAFIKSIEAFDSNALLGVRGKKGLEMLPSYDKSVKSLAAFTEVALRSVEIPMAATEDIPAASTE